MYWHIINWLYRKSLTYQLSLGYRIYGIAYIARKLSYLPDFLILPTLRRYGATVGERTVFKNPIWIDNAYGGEDTTGDFSHLAIGTNCYIGKDLLIDLPDRIIIEDEVLIGARVCIFTHHDCGNRIMSKWYPRKKGPVKLSNGCFIGPNSTILAGVTLGRCCMVAAGSVVTRDFEDYTMVPVARLKR